MGKARALLLLLLASALMAGRAYALRHFIPHSHQDLGWLKTIQGYYDSLVRNILASVFDALENPNAQLNRKFVYAEVGYLKMFLEDDPQARSNKINRIKSLMGNGKFEFVNGGMSQADSACPFYEDIIDNYFYGMRYLKLNLDAEAQGAWQIDPFGHSQALVYLSRKFGLKHAVINRIGTDLKAARQQSQALQFKWAHPDGSSTLVHLTTNGYTSPDGISCDPSCYKFLFNKHYFESYLSRIDPAYKHDPFYLIGEDFNYYNAGQTLDFLDYVLTVSKDIKYSLFSEYAKPFEPIGDSLPTFTGDFFVYSDGAHSEDHWSGYFTTKPRLKYGVRQLGSNVRAVTAFVVKEILCDSKVPEGLKNLTTHRMVGVAEDFGLLLHHDTITGTSLEAVDADYFARIANIETRLLDILKNKFGDGVVLCSFMEILAGRKDCQLSWAKGDSIKFRVYNPSLFKEENKLISVVLANKDAGDLLFELAKVSPVQVNIPATSVCSADKLTCEVHFTDTVEPFQVNDYVLTIKSKQSEALGDNESATNSKPGDLFNPVSLAKATDFEFSDFGVTVNPTSVLYRRKDGSNVAHEIFYQSIASQYSGHYILKYAGHLDFRNYGNFEGVSEIRSAQIEGVYITGPKVDLKIYKQVGKRFFNIQTLVKKSAEFNDGIDCVLNVRTQSIDNQGFATDSNGLFEMSRVKGPQFERSVFPFTSFVKIKDKSNGSGIEIFNDRSQGVISDEPGNIKIYIQRSASRDDNKGNPETLSVKENVAMTHSVLYFQSEDKEYTESRQTLLRAQLSNPLVLFYPDKESAASKSPALEPAFVSSNPDVKLLFNIITEKQVIIRAQSVNRYTAVSVDARNMLEELLGKHTFFNVDFDYFVRSSSNEQRPLKDSYTIRPLEFETFLLAL